MLDPLAEAEEVAALVCDGKRRKYHRFRAAKFYGGIATADCVGCCLRCAFCWAWRQMQKPQAHGELSTPGQVANRLASIARRKRFRQIRISGNEPTLDREHLLAVLELVPEDLTFILETNGILLGDDPGYAQELAAFPNLHVRVSLKGATKDDFSRLTGASPEGFRLQLAALEHLEATGVSAHPAVMASFSSREDLRNLRERLARISPRFADFEVEEVLLYGHVKEQLRRAKLYPEGERPSNEY